MELIKYSNSIVVNVLDNSDHFIESFFRKVQEKLWDFETKSDVKNGTIAFKRIQTSVVNKKDALKILREGFVQVDRIEPDRIKIFWEIKLDNTLFLSFMIGLVFGIVTAYTGSTIVIAGITGLLFTAATYFIVYSILRIRIDEIIETSI